MTHDLDPETPIRLQKFIRDILKYIYVTYMQYAVVCFD